MTEQQRKNLAIAERYIELYNRDPEIFVRQCYHEDFHLSCMGVGDIRGIEDFVDVEKRIHAAAPKRRMDVQRMHATDESVVVEVLLRNPDQGEDWALPFVAVLEMRGDKIAVDRSYADFRQWPGLDL